jgi:hypothetical protein
VELLVFLRTTVVQDAKSASGLTEEINRRMPSIKKLEEERNAPPKSSKKSDSKKSL